MDLNQLVARAKAILSAPKAEWPIISAEPASVSDLYKNYIIWLAIIPAVAGFIKGSLIGYSLFGVTVRSGIGQGITGMILQYLLSLVLIYVLALIINALAPSFGGQKSQTQALKTAAYAYTAYWVASIGVVLPWLGALIVIAGGIYSIYLLYLGLPHTMQCPADKATGYTAVTIIIAVVLGWILALIVGGMVGTSAMLGTHGGSSSENVQFDQDSALGKLAMMGQQMDAASKQLEAAQKSGDAQAQAEATGKMLGSLLGGGDQVESLAPDVLKPLLPDSLAGLKRTEASAERNAAMGMQVSSARATYSDGGQKRLQLEITDMGSAKGLMALAGLAGMEKDQETEHGYTKAYKQNGRMVQEEWDNQTHRGEYSVVVADRFQVKVSGTADSMDQIKAAVAAVNLAKLEALKSQGVKKG